MNEVIKYFESIEARMAGYETRIATLEARIASLTETLATNEAVIASMEAEIEELRNRPQQAPELPIIDEPIIEDPIFEEPVTEEEEPAIEEEPAAEEPAAEEPVVEPEPVIEEVKEEPKAEEPKVEEPKVEEEKPSPKAAIYGKAVDDIRMAISLGDRFLYQRELFGQNAELMQRTLTELNGLGSFDEAVAYISSHFQWDTESSTYQQFLVTLHRRFG